jgi:hypothetical protein
MESILVLRVLVLLFAVVTCPVFSQSPRIAGATGETELDSSVDAIPESIVTTRDAVAGEMIGLIPAGLSIG